MSWVWALSLIPAGVLLGSALAKLIAARNGELSWPAGPVLYRWWFPASSVIAVEIGVAVTAAIMHPGWLMGLLVAVTYGLLAVAAATLRGQACACFGASVGTIGSRHVGANATVAVLTMPVSLLASDTNAPLWLRLLWIFTVGLAALGISYGTRKPWSRGRRSGDDDCVTAADRVLILTMPGCPACRALETVVGDGGDSVVDWELIETGNEPHAALAEDTYPCALALGTDGTPVCRPRWGLEDIRRLVDAVQDTRAGQIST